VTNATPSALPPHIPFPLSSISVAIFVFLLIQLLLFFASGGLRETFEKSFP
jgi:hypothetical protein